MTNTERAALVGLGGGLYLAPFMIAFGVPMPIVALSGAGLVLWFARKAGLVNGPTDP